MLFTRSWTKRPREALLQLDIGLGFCMFSIGGSLRAPMRYHPCKILILTYARHPGKGQYLVGSLTGAVALTKPIFRYALHYMRGWVGGTIVVT